MASLPNEILPQILLLIQSPLLQGGALTALLELFQALVTTGLPKHGFRDFLQVDPPLMWLCFDCIHKNSARLLYIDNICSRRQCIYCNPMDSMVFKLSMLSLYLQLLITPIYNPTTTTSMGFAVHKQVQLQIWISLIILE